MKKLSIIPNAKPSVYLALVALTFALSGVGHATLLSDLQTEVTDHFTAIMVTVGVLLGLAFAMPVAKSVFAILRGIIAKFR